MTDVRPNSTGHTPVGTPPEPAITRASDWRAQAWAFLRSHGNRVPPAIACPISFRLMLDPVSVANGQTYDRPSIRTWFASPGAFTENGRFVDFSTHEVLTNSVLCPNLTVRAQVAAFKEAVLTIAPSAAHYFEPPASTDLVVAPRRPSRYMAASWVERRDTQRPALVAPRYPRGGSPAPVAETTNDINAVASRAVDRALADVGTRPWPGIDASSLRQHLDDVIAVRNQDEQDAAEADADEEIRELREAMGVNAEDPESDADLASEADFAEGLDTWAFDPNPEPPVDSDEEIERELNEAFWHA